MTLTRKQWAVVVGLLLTAALSSSALIAGLGAQSPPSSNVHISGTGRISH